MSNETENTVQQHTPGTVYDKTPYSGGSYKKTPSGVVLQECTGDRECACMHPGEEGTETPPATLDAPAETGTPTAPPPPQAAETHDVPFGEAE